MEETTDHSGEGEQGKDSQPERSNRPAEESTILKKIRRLKKSSCLKAQMDP